MPSGTEYYISVELLKKLKDVMDSSHIWEDGTESTILNAENHISVSTKFIREILEQALQLNKEHSQLKETNKETSMVLPALDNVECQDLSIEYTDQWLEDHDKRMQELEEKQKALDIGRGDIEALLIKNSQKGFKVQVNSMQLGEIFFWSSFTMDLPANEGDLPQKIENSPVKVNLRGYIKLDIYEKSKNLLDVFEEGSFVTRKRLKGERFLEDLEDNVLFEWYKLRETQAGRIFTTEKNIKTIIENLNSNLSERSLTDSNVESNQAVDITGIVLIPREMQAQIDPTIDQIKKSIKEEYLGANIRSENDSKGRFLKGIALSIMFGTFIMASGMGMAAGIIPGFGKNLYLGIRNGAFPHLMGIIGAITIIMGAVTILMIALKLDRQYQVKKITQMQKYEMELGMVDTFAEQLNRCISKQSKGAQDLRSEIPAIGDINHNLNNIGGTIILP